MVDKNMLEHKEKQTESDTHISIASVIYMQTYQHYFGPGPHQAEASELLRSWNPPGRRERDIMKTDTLIAFIHQHVTL